MSPPLHLVRSESKIEVRSRPWLQDQISTDTVLHSHHNATNWTSCLNTWQREQKSRNLSWQGWLCYAEESDVRGEMSVFMPKSDSHCIFPIVILRNTMLPDCGWHNEEKTSYKTLPRRPARDENWSQNFNDTDNLQQTQHLAENPNYPANSTDTRLILATLWSQMSEVRCRSSCWSQIPTVSLLSSFSATPTYEMSTRWKRIRAIVRVGANPSGTKKTLKKGRKHLWDLDIYDGIPFQLTRFYCPTARSTNRSSARLRERLTQFSLPECSPPPSLTSVHHEKCKQLRCVTAKMSDTRWPQTKQPDARSPSFQNDISTDTSQPSSCKTLNIWHTTSNRAHVTSTRSKSRMSEVRCLSSYRSQIPTLFILSPFFAIPKFEM